MTEVLVRPFQTGDVTPPTVLPFAQPTQEAKTVRLTIGRIGSTKTFHLSTSYSQTVYTIKYPKERSTQYEPQSYSSQYDTTNVTR
jgi:hypothetical protein